MEIIIVFIAALLTALATGLGALPLLAMRGAASRAVELGHAVAAGLMIAASISLIIEGLARGPARLVLGAVIGIVLIRLVSARMDGHDEEQLFSGLVGADARRALLVIGVMTAHSFAEGIGIGVGFAESGNFGWSVTALLALHNIPEGLAISLLLVPKGMSVGRAAAWSVFTSLPQPLVAVPAFMLVLAFAPLLPVGLGLAAGAMLWMSLAELLGAGEHEASAPASAAPTAARHGQWAPLLTCVGSAATATGLLLLVPMG